MDKVFTLTSENINNLFYHEKFIKVCFEQIELSKVNGGRPVI
jgi:hypothetical protein